MFGACPCLLLFSYFTHTSTSACLFYMREHCLPPALISFTFSSSCCRSRHLFFSFKSQFYLVSPSFTLVIGWTVQSYPFLYPFFCLSCKFQGLHVCVALRIGNLLWSQGGYGFGFVSQVFLNSSAGRFNWLLKLSLLGMQNWYQMDGRGGNQ